VVAAHGPPYAADTARRPMAGALLVRDISNRCALPLALPIGRSAHNDGSADLCIRPALSAARYG
jgi:hypothetical protein